MYRLDNSFTRYGFTVTVIGCGGTGAFVADGLCRLLPPYARLALVDHDRVEERNLSRQDFFREDLGQFKSEALAKRLSRKYDRAIAYGVFPVALTQLNYPGLVIGCVDNGLARRDIARRLSERSSLGWVGGFSAALPRQLQSGPQPQTDLWWLDSGNALNWGQILIGNASREQLRGAFDKQKGICLLLPLPTVQRPELLMQANGSSHSCAEVIGLNDQSPVINQVMAVIILEFIHHLLAGTLTWMGAYIDMDNGTFHTVPAHPELVAQITGLPLHSLFQRGKE